MNRLTLLFLLLPVLALDACGPQQTADAPAPASYEIFGEAFDDIGAVPVQAVVAERAEYVGRAVKVEGMVSEVCQMKGCWLTLQAGDGDNVRVLVARNADGDYAFTVPKDLSGRRVVVAGTLAEAMLSEDEQRHLAEDAGEETDAEALQPKPELHLTAQGVLVEVRGP